MKMNIVLVSFLYLLGTALSFAGQKIQPRTVKAQVAYQLLTQTLATGEYKGKNKAGKSCSVEIKATSDSPTTKYFNAIVSDPDIDMGDISLSENFTHDVTVYEYKTGLKIQSSEYDGDESQGGYLITTSIKVMKKNQNQWVVTGETRYDFDSGDRDDVTKAVCVVDIK